jgi:rSAM/selenodomain-associated transferase 2
VIVADGGSTDGTADVARRIGAHVVAAPRGRGSQLAAGARAATGDWFLFLHADTHLAANWRDAVVRFLANEGTGKAAFFRFRLDDDRPAACRLERMVAWRCRALAQPYGDQGLLIHRTLYDAVGGFRPLPLMEDVDIVRRIGRRRLAMLDCDAVTSAARYRRAGYLARSARNLSCLGLYYLGVPPRLIVRLYA